MKGGAEDGRTAGIHCNRCVGSRNGIQDQRRNLAMESLLIALVCNADLCGTYPKVQKLRECLTIEDAIWLHEHNKASHE